jgi:hypothetical protein
MTQTSWPTRKVAVPRTRVARIVRTSRRKANVTHLIALFHREGDVTTLCGYRAKSEPRQDGDRLCQNCSATLGELNRS